MKVINKGVGIKHIGSVTIAPGEIADIDDSWESSIGGDLQKVTAAESEQEDAPAKRGRPAKVKEVE